MLQSVAELNNVRGVQRRICINCTDGARCNDETRQLAEGLGVEYYEIHIVDHEPTVTIVEVSGGGRGGYRQALVDGRARRQLHAIPDREGGRGHRRIVTSGAPLQSDAVRGPQRPRRTFARKWPR